VSQVFVALDIETTGLDRQRDAITEVGAVRFTADGEVLDRFESLVNPGREIPAFVQELTGVTDAAVRDAPPLAAVGDGLRAFVGEATIVGQNIGFDLGHLRSGGVDLPNAAIDTAALSRLLLPASQKRSLGALAELLGVEVTGQHRALADATTAAGVFVALCRRANDLPRSVRQQLARLVAMTDPPLARLLAGEDWDETTPGERALPAVRPGPPLPPLVRRDPREPIAPEIVSRVFEAAAVAVPGFERRGQQLEMAEGVRRAFGGGHWLIEAGTGVGKSLAYLVPAALHALHNGERVVISTNTHNLQEQLVQKDVPALRQMLRAAGVIADDADLRVSLLKGRQNYLCLRRWTASFAASLGDPDFASLAASLVLWLPETTTGDRSELNLDGRDWQTWLRFSAQEADCLVRQNAYVRENLCFLQRARKAAESAHIVVVNHALLLADLATGGSALPPYDHLIIDEAHNLEDAATRQFGGSVSRRLLAEALDGVYRRPARDQREGGVATLLEAFPEGPVQEAGRALREATIAAHALLAPCFEALAALLPGNGDDDRVTLDAALRAQPAWMEPELAWDRLDRGLAGVITKARDAAELVAGTATLDEPDAIAGEIETAINRVDEHRATLARLMGESDHQQVTWLARERDGTASVNAAPLDVGPRLWEELLQKKRTVVATSATLAAGGSMAYAARRLGFEAPETLQLGSPFDYKRSTLLTAVTDVPDPGDPAYIDGTARAVEVLVKASGGRALVLFTSHQHLRRVAERVRAPLAGAGIAVLAQDIDGSARRVIDDLRASPRSVVLGTSSLFEGVDLKGEALSLLVIARLPFAVPTEPVTRARAAQYDRPFEQYTLPHAVLRFRQGFGRLIRDRDDYGVVAILDRRIYEKPYGQVFVDSLPPVTRFRGTTEAVAEQVRQWLAG
jgi:DNA polymerase-3 subunit epsilon/ATP-dependent DNA helicase DinG